MTEPHRPPSDLVGSHVGNYVVERALGKGGMGEVYLARHPELPREVAVKVLTGALSSDATAIARFRQEAMAACRIGHDAIVEILDTGQLPDGRHYYVMEYLPGQSLQQYLELHGVQAPAASLELLRPVLAALEAAHAVGIVHRDIKPDNIFLAAHRDGTTRVKVLDFGIAKLVDTTVPPLVATQSGALIGTPLYMSPEQCAGTGEIGPATDLYALGAVLFYLLTGRPPFIGEGMGEVLVQHLQSPPPSVRDFRPELSENLDAVLQIALAKKPAERFDRVAALSAALEAAIAGAAPTQVAPAGATLRLAESSPGAAPLSAAIAYSGTQPATGSPVSRSLNETSLSAAAAQHVALPTPVTTASTATTSQRTLLIAVVVALIIGAGAVAVGVLLGRSPDRSSGADRTSQPGKTTGATAAVAPDGGAVRVRPRPTTARPATAQPTTMRSAPTPIELPPVMRPRPIPLSNPAPTRAAMRRPPARPRTHSKWGLPPGVHKPLMKPSYAQRAIGRGWVKMAKKDMRRGRCSAALPVARNSFMYYPTYAAIRIMGLCACRIGNDFHRRLALWAYRRLGSNERAKMKATCPRNKIQLP